MEISGIEKFSRYLALTALSVGVLLAAMVYFGVLKMHGNGAAASGAAGQEPRGRLGSNANMVMVAGAGAVRAVGAGGSQLEGNTKGGTPATLSPREPFQL